MKKMMMIVSLVAAFAFVGLAALDSAPAHASVQSQVESELIEAAPASSVNSAVASSTLASAKFQVTLQWDAGATGVSQVFCLASPQQTIQLMTNAVANFPSGSQYCYRTCAALGGDGGILSCSPDCTKDIIPNRVLVATQTPDAGNSNGVTFVTPGPSLSDPIQMGPEKCIAISSLDAGNPNVNLYLLTKNLP